MLCTSLNCYMCVCLASHEAAAKQCHANLQANLEARDSDATKFFRRHLEQSVDLLTIVLAKHSFVLNSRISCAIK